MHHYLIFILRLHKEKMNMNNLWNQRLNKYQKKLLKYLRFVFNDHFIIALFFILGAACYGYFILIDNYITKYTFQDKLVAVIILYLFC